MASDDEAAVREERLKSSLWYSIGQFVDEESLQQNFTTTPQFIGALTEMVYTQIEHTSRDLEMFAKHAGRKTINPDDVMLLSRRNEGLETLLKQALDDIRANEERSGEKTGRGKGTAKATGKGKGKAKK
jgi:hypothetical protein